MEASAVKRLFIEKIKNHEFRIFTDRTDLIVKNKLYSGGVNIEFVLDKIEKCKRKHYHPEFSVDADDNEAHIFIIEKWYIKFFLKDDMVNIVSVHKEERHD